MKKMMFLALFLIFPMVISAVCSAAENDKKVRREDGKNSESASKNFLRRDAEALRFFRTRGTFFGGRNSEGDGYSYRRQKHLRQI